MNDARRSRSSAVALMAALAGCVATDAPESPAGRQADAVVVGANHRGILRDFTRSELYHRADIAHLTGDLFAIGAVSSSGPAGDATGEGEWILYDWGTDMQPAFGSFGTGVQSVRVADGCIASGTRWAWYAWQQNGGVYVRRRSASGWGGSAYFISGARFPVVERGTDDNGTDRVVLFYERSSGGRSYLYYRFLSCGGAVGTAYALRSVGDPWYIWHIEAAFNPNLDRWRIFWDERSGYYAYMRTKYLLWNGVHSGSTFAWNCEQGALLGDSLAGRDASDERIELLPAECEDWDYPVAGDESVLAPGNGCKRFFVSFDDSLSNGSQRYLVATYARALFAVDENGAVTNLATGMPPAPGDPPGSDGFSIPLGGVCRVSSCSYQEIGFCWSSDYGTRSVLSHRRFTDYFNPCPGGDHPICDADPLGFEEYPITPLVRLPYPMAMASSDEATVVLYQDTYEDDQFAGDLFATVIDQTP